MSGVFAPQTRRTFVKNALCITAGAAIVPGCGIGDPPTIEEVAAYLAGLIRHPEQADGLGGIVLQADNTIHSLSFAQLTEVIMKEVGVGDLNASGVSIEKLGSNVTNKVRQDFADETVVAVDGWLLSQTEARMCALVHLYRGANSK